MPRDPVNPVEITLEDFKADRQGGRFTDVLDNPRVQFEAWLAFFNSPARRQRMADAEIDHLRPAARRRRPASWKTTRLSTTCLSPTPTAT